MSLDDELNIGISQLGLDVQATQKMQLLSYLNLLHKWNKVYNLTAIRDKNQMISHHLLDSLAVLPYLWPGRWLDVGCGAGLPGIVLAIMRPDWQFILLDSNSKKTGFVQQAIIELDLKNILVRCDRVEKFRTDVLFNGVISRAFTELGDFVEVTKHLVESQGRWAAMKGVAEKELHTIPLEFQVDHIVSLSVPGLHAARSLVVVSRNGV